MYILSKEDDSEWIVDGTPTDCVILALNHIMKIINLILF